LSTTRVGDRIYNQSWRHTARHRPILKSGRYPQRPKERMRGFFRKYVKRATSGRRRDSTPSRPDRRTAYALRLAVPVPASRWRVNMFGDVNIFLDRQPLGGHGPGAVRPHFSPSFTRYRFPFFLAWGVRPTTGLPTSLQRVQGRSCSPREARYQRYSEPRGEGRPFPPA